MNCGALDLHSGVEPLICLHTHFLSLQVADCEVGKGRASVKVQAGCSSSQTTVGLCLLWCLVNNNVFLFMSLFLAFSCLRACKTRIDYCHVYWLF